MRIEIETITDSYRAATEDRLLVLPTDGGVVIAVADGMGGRAGGARAAEVFIDAVREAVPRVLDPADAAAWDALLVSADRFIRNDPDAGETTAVVLAVSDRRIAGASVGDSGAWMILADRRYDLTAGQRYKPGLGVGMASPTPFRAKPVPGTLLVATDGLFKYANPEAICKVVRSAPPGETGRALVDLVRMRGGGLQDDVAIVLCRLG